MLKYPALFPRRRIAKHLGDYQRALAEVAWGRRDSENVPALVWDFMSRALGHANECLFDSALISNVDDISIPGGEDEANRFVVEIITGEAGANQELFDRAIAACSQHRVRWLMWTDGRFWNVAHVLGESAVPAPFFAVDVLEPSRELLSRLYVLSFEGMLDSTLERTWQARRELVPPGPMADFSNLQPDEIHLGDNL